MEELLLFIKVLLAGIFLSTGLAKRGKMEEHVAIVADYKILPSALVRPFAKGEVYAELALGVLLLVGAGLKWAALGSLLLLLVYSLAIVVNLLRGRREISCGCGGVAGNHQLSWRLLLRNALLITACGLLWQQADALSFADFYSLRAWLAMFAAGLALMAWALYAELGKVSARIHTMWSNEQGGTS